jgi:hypothetical protein
LGTLIARALWLLTLSYGFAWAQAAPSIPPEMGAAGAVSRIVQGIVSYTRWPTPPARVRLCIVGQSEYADALFPNGLQTVATTIQTQRMPIGDSHLGAECDVVYSGVLTDSERDRLRSDLAGHPVLTISEHDDTCSSSSAFCLVIHGIDVSFAVNLDAVARSGVRVNPQVLLLGRRRGLKP